MSEALPPVARLFTVVLPKLKQGRGAGVGRRITRLTFGVMGLIIAAVIFAATAWFLDLCYRVEVIGPVLCRRLLDVVVLVLASVLFLSNVITSLGSFFMAKDLELLVTAPVHPRTFFAARFLEQMTLSSWMVLAFGLPILLAFALVCGTPLTLVAMVVTLVPLMMIPAAIGFLITLLLVRTLPAARVRDLVVGISFIAFLVLYLLTRILEPEQFLNPDGFSTMVGFLASFTAPSGGFLPTHWAAVVVGSTFKDDIGTGNPMLMYASLVTAAGAVYTVASFSFRRLYLSAYSRSQQSRGVAIVSRLWSAIRGRPIAQDGEIRAPGRRGAESDWLRVVGWWHRSPITREFMIKDLKVLLRDPTQWSQLVLLLALIFVYLYNFRHFKRIGESGLISPLGLFILSLGLSSFVTTAVCVRFAYPLVSTEGRMLWLLYTAPIKPSAVLRAKFTSALPAIVFISVAIAVASTRILEINQWMTALALAVSLLTALCVSSIAIGIGAILPDFKAENPAKVATSFGGLVCMSVAMFVAFTIVALAGYPAFVIYYGRGGWTSPSVLVCGGIALMVLVLSLWIPLRLGARALDRREG